MTDQRGWKLGKWQGKREVLIRFVRSWLSKRQGERGIGVIRRGKVLCWRWPVAEGLFRAREVQGY